LVRKWENKRPLDRVVPLSGEALQHRIAQSTRHPMTLFERRCHISQLASAIQLEQPVPTGDVRCVRILSPEGNFALTEVVKMQSPPIGYEPNKSEEASASGHASGYLPAGFLGEDDGETVSSLSSNSLNEDWMFGELWQEYDLPEIGFEN
jgi:hypothetical protein